MSATIKAAGFREVAERAHVSVTTVERVLNERGSVSAETRMKVLVAAKELGLRRILPNPDYGNLRIEAILPVNPTQYWAKLSAGLKEAAKQLPRGIAIHRTFVPENDPQAMIRAISAPSMRHSALIVAADVDQDIARTLLQVVEQGEILVLVSTRLHELPAHAFSGVDNLAAGRTAASLINFALRGEAGPVIVLQANSTMQSHLDRIAGFRAELKPECKTEVVVTNEIPGASWRFLSERLTRGEMPVAIYETGDAGDEIAPLLRKMERRSIWIGHERNTVHDSLMREGLLDFVLDQDPESQAHWALRHILSELRIITPNFVAVRQPELRLLCAANLGAVET